MAQAKKIKSEETAPNEMDTAQLLAKIAELESLVKQQSGTIDVLQSELAEVNDEKLSLENSLRESEALYNVVIENSLDGTLIIDQDYILLYGNEEMFKIGGYSSMDMFGEDLRKFIPKEDIPFFEERISFSRFNKGVDNRFESAILHKDGIKKNVYISASLNDDFQGKSVIICQILDISEIKKAEEIVRKINEDLELKVIERTKQLESALSNLKVENLERKRAEEELQAAKEEVQNALEQEKELNILKSRFISMISHEYRTPLTVILTSSYLIEQFYQGPNQLQFNKFLDKIRASVKSMTQLLQDVLTIGKSEAGKTTLNLSTIRVVELCKEIIEESQVIDNNLHTFELNFSDKSLEIDSDDKQLRHILSNLVLNAAKYSPNAKVVVINILDLDDKVMFEVIDQGIGIPEQDQEHLFDAFYRAGNVGAISGTGLGLAIVKKCVDLLEGEITFASVKDEGTKFNVLVPKKYSQTEKAE